MRPRLVILSERERGATAQPRVSTRATPPSPTGADGKDDTILNSALLGFRRSFLWGTLCGVVGTLVAELG